MIKKVTIDKNQLLQMLSGSTAIIGPEDLETRINSLPSYDVYPDQIEISSYLWFDSIDFKFMLSRDVVTSNNIKYEVICQIHPLFLTLAKLNNPDVNIGHMLRKSDTYEQAMGVLDQINSWSNTDWFKNAVHQFDMLIKEYISNNTEKKQGE